MYGDDLGLEDWLTARGYTLPETAPDPEILLTRATSFIDATYEALWTGQRTDPLEQEEGWPRTGATLGCTIAIADDVIPLAVINATYRAAWLEAESPGLLSPAPVTGPRVKRFRVEGAVEEEYFDDGASAPGASGSVFVDPEIDAAMRRFICDRSGGFLFMSVGS